MNSKERRTSRAGQLSLERLESRILLAPVNPGQPAILYDGDQLFFVQGAGSDPPTDYGGESPTTVIIATFEGSGAVQFYNAFGDDYLDTTTDWGDKIGDMAFYGVDETSNLFIQTGEFREDFGISDIDTYPLNTIVQLVTDPVTGRYIWWNADPSWMDEYVHEEYAFAPDGSGGAVITGNISFDAASTGFGTFALDGALKGSIGVPGATLGPGETLHEVRVGYINGPQWDFQGMTTGGTYIEGNIDRLLVQSTVAELDETNRMGLGDRGGAAYIYVGGHLIEFQASGTIRADITVIGNSTTEPVFDFDYRVYSGAADNTTSAFADVEGESYLTGVPAGFTNDIPDRAYVVGSPTGTFAIEGFVEAIGWDKADYQDWYVFSAGLGQEISVTMDYGHGAPAWVFAPSGRLVTVATPDEPVSFVADEGGYYRLMVGSVYDPAIDIAYRPHLLDISYRVVVSGTAPVQLGGVVVGSDVFANALTDDTLEFSDDMGDTWVWVGTDAGFIDVRNLGNYADANLYVGGNIGYITANNATSSDFDYPYFNIGGDFDRLEVRTGDFMFGDGANPDVLGGYMTVGGNLGEVYVAGTFGQPASLAVASVFFKTPPVTVGGHVGSVVTGGSFFAWMTVYQDGVDLLYVGGDFGSLAAPSRLDTEVGTDVAFAYVEGAIYHQGTTVVSEVQPVTVTEPGHLFVDDGGSALYLTPVSTTWVSSVEIAVIVTKQGTITTTTYNTDLVPATLQYRYLPIGRPGGGQVGAVITEITATTDSVIIGIESGRADIGMVHLGGSADSFLGIASPDPLAELDVYYVDAAGANVSAIANYTHQGDILNVNVGSVGSLFAGGHIGLTERFAPEAGALPNPIPTQFAPPPVFYVSQGQALSAASGGTYTDDYSRYFNGVVAAGNVGRVQANGSIGNVYAGGSIGAVRADADGVSNGTAFNFRGHHRDARTWDGITGVVFAGGDIGFVDPGDGVYGGRGERPVGGVFTSGALSTFSASDSVIEGPVFAAGGIRLFSGYQTLLREASIGAGAEFSDWPIYAPNPARATTQGVRLDNLVLRGPGSGIESSMIQVGVLGNLYLGPLTDGWTSSQIWAIGDPATQQGVNRITILGGGMDGTEPLPYGMWTGGVGTNERLGTIVLRGAGVNMINMDIESFKSINSISVQADIIADVASSISGTFFINSISANSIVGGGNVYIGAGRLGQLVVRQDVDAEISVDGAVGLLSIGGEILRDFTTVGPHGHLDYAVVGRGISGDLSAFSYIGVLDVLTGDLAGSVEAGGSNINNQAIGRIVVRNGDLVGSVSTVVQTAALRPGGGIGGIYVNGDVLLGADITATSYYDPIRGNRMPGDIGIIRVVGDLDANVTIQKNEPLNPNDPGGDLHSLIVIGGDLNGDVTVYGDIGQIVVQGGSIVGTITSLGSDVRSIIVIASGDPAIGHDINVAGNLGLLKVIGGDVDGSVTVGGTLNVLWLNTDVDVTGAVTAGAINRAYFNSPNALDVPVTATGHIGYLLLRGGLGAAGSITAGDGLDLLHSLAPVAGSIGVTGNVGTIVVSATPLDPSALSGLLTVDGDVQRLLVINGQVSVSSDVSVSGDVGLLQILNLGGTAVDGTIFVGDYLGRGLLSGDVDGPITVGDNELGDGAGLLLIRGDLDADVTVEGDVGRLLIIGGQVTDNGTADPRINVTGNVNQLQVFGYTGGGAIIDDDIRVGDKLAYFLVRGGSFDGTLEAGTMGRILYYTPDGIAEQITSHDGLDLLVVPWGAIDAPIDVFHHVGRIVAQRGVTANGDITVGSGAPGSGTMNDLFVSGGNLEGDVHVDGYLSRLIVRGSVRNNLVDVNGGSLAQLTVLGDVLGSDITVSGALGQVLIALNYTDSNINANSLTRVIVGGQVASVAPPDDEVIHAAVGRFDLFAAGVYYDIHDAAGEMINGVHAYVV